MEEHDTRTVSKQIYLVQGKHAEERQGVKFDNIGQCQVMEHITATEWKLGWLTQASVSHYTAQWIGVLDLEPEDLSSNSEFSIYQLCDLEYFNCFGPHVSSSVKMEEISILQVYFYNIVYTCIYFLTQGLAPSKCAMNCAVFVVLKKSTGMKAVVCGIRKTRKKLQLPPQTDGKGLCQGTDNIERVHLRGMKRIHLDLNSLRGNVLDIPVIFY